MYNHFKEMKVAEGHRQDLLREAERARRLPKRRNGDRPSLSPMLTLGGTAIGLIFLLVAVL